VFDEDLSEFVHDDEHAETATITGFGNVLGIWRDGYAETLEMESSDPRFECAASAVPAIAQRTALTRVKTGLTYAVASVEPDGHGWVALVLEETS